MARFTLNGEPQISGTSVHWAATLDPGTFEAATGFVDTLDCFKMTSNDPAGLDVQSELVQQLELRHDETVMPGDGYSNSADLSDLHDGYYHILLSPDGYEADCETYRLHVRVEGGTPELKTWHRE